MIIQETLRRELDREIPILTAQILALYRELDKKTGLRGSKIPVEFTYDQEVLGSYTRAGGREKEHFSFSLLFVGYALQKPLSKEERMDLYKHEYAHYMQYHMTIPEKYQWQPGTHGSAWKYCCSIVGAVPSPCYRAGEALRKQDYQKVLRNPIQDKTVPLVDRYRREKEYRNKENNVIRYEIGDLVQHPKYGEGRIEEIQQTGGGVRLRIRFAEEVVKLIDQRWLIRNRYQPKAWKGWN